MWAPAMTVQKPFQVPALLGLGARAPYLHNEAQRRCWTASIQRLAAARSMAIPRSSRPARSPISVAYLGSL